MTSILKLESSEQGEASDVLQKSSVYWGHLGGAPVLLCKGVSKHSVRPVLNLLSRCYHTLYLFSKASSQAAS